MERTDKHKKELPSYFEWTFKNKWYYIILVVYFFLNDSSRNYFNGTDDSLALFGSVIGLSIIVALFFYIAYLIYRAGFYRNVD